MDASISTPSFACMDILVAEFLGCPFSEAVDEPVNEILRLCSFHSLSRLKVNQNGKLENGPEKKKH
ncbi:hypothetical protein SAY87_018209 [Trapa incisa]|uniref:Sulfotransferase n=1 Tax=Trapa incisa TaxID=236973 RepID=A0AAN7QTK6_9MYRT|nr:hypothetical protein SAY87_018209 [Trapa incisa]